MREDVTFPSGGERCAAWLYRPDDDDRAGVAPRPCVVMAHGFSGTRELGLDLLAERFAAAGLVALVFDYRHFGASGGTPRQLLLIRRQLADYRAAVAYARTLLGVDPDRVAVWGTALSSGHAIVTAARDPRIAAVVAQLPYLAAPTPQRVGVATSVRLALDGVADEVNGLVGHPPRTIAVIAEPGGPGRAVLMDPELAASFRAVVPEGALWRNAIAARFMLHAPFYRPGRHLAQVRCPTLFVVADHDPVSPPERSIAAIERLPQGELVRYPISHFEIGLPEQLAVAARDQAAFLLAHLGSGTARKENPSVPSSPPAVSLPPGPRLPQLVQAVRYSQQWATFSLDMRARYGGTWTLRLPGFPPSVVTTDRDAIRRLFTGDPLAKRHANDLLRPLFGSRSLLLLDPADHLARRKLELAPFHSERVRRYHDRVVALLEQEVAGWAPGAEVEVHPRAKALTLEIILELVLGVRDPELRNRVTTVLGEVMQPRHSVAMFLPQWLSRRASWNVLSRGFWAIIDRLDGLVLGHIEATRADPRVAEREDVLAMLMSARDEHGEGLTDRELRDELVTLIIAGHETTSTAIAWSIDLLAHHPEVAAELRERLAAGDREYLKAVAAEVLRLRTVLPVTAARQPLEPFDVAGHRLPEGTIVLVNADGLHHDPELYPEPDAFRPERFLGEKPESYAYLPWGGGARRCLGISLAMLEFEQAVETIVTSCELAPVGPPARPVRVGTTQAPGNRGRVRILSNTLATGAREGHLSPA